MNERIERQIEFINEELFRVKELYNKSGFDVTSSLSVICRQYRTSLKQQLEILRMNLE